MKILFDNYIHRAGVTALNTDPNFSVGNLQSQFLLKRFQSLTNTDTLTITFLTLTQINCLYYAYTNATSVVFKMYNGASLLATFSGADAHHFAPVFVDKVEVVLTAAAPAYIGKVGLGMEESTNPPESFWEEEFEDRSLVSESQSGQVQQEYVKPLRKYSFKLPGLSRDAARAYQETYLNWGIGSILWIDPATDDLPVMYGRMVEAPATSKNKKQYQLQLEFMEAR